MSSSGSARLEAFFVRQRLSVSPYAMHESRFLDQVQTYHHMVSNYYHDPRVEKRVKELVPWQDLFSKSNQKLEKLKASKKLEEPNVDIDGRDLYLIELFDWYKNSFFRWFDKGICSNSNCAQNGLPMKLCNQSGFPTDDDKRFGASRIELYQCSSCGSEFRFPRYNHPLKLLETRTGRCGEWANCITCICVVLGFEARLVLDWTDHVWTEIYSESQKRWMHADSCENGIDRPLVYESGWNKKLTYCIGIAKDEVQDVTWRYTNDPGAVLQRRRQQCRETWVTRFICEFNKTLRAILPENRQNVLLTRTVGELVEFIWVPGLSKQLQSSEQQGRQSGSAAWRLARDEMGKPATVADNFVFTPNASDRVFKVIYNPVTDEYKLGSEVMKGWQSAVNQSKNIFRKVENDWRMTYLARCEGTSEPGFISWKFDLSSSDWTAISFHINGKVYENAVVELSLEVLPSGDKRAILLNTPTTIKRNDLPNNVSSLILSAHLSGGEGNVAWQKTQLFRQSLNNKDAIDFSVEIAFASK